MAEKPEHEESLWVLIIAPTIWAIHLMASYLTAAIWCAKFADSGQDFGFVRTAIGIYTLLALLGIGVTGWYAYRRHSYRGSRTPHDADTSRDRHRFLGFAGLLLSALSGVATAFAGLVAFYFRSCD